MEKLIRKLADVKQPIIKIVRFLEYNDTGKTSYEQTINGITTTVVDGEPTDGTSIIRGIKLSTSENNLTIPAIDSYGIVVFVNKDDAYVLSMDEKAYERKVITNSDGTKKVIEIKIVNNKTIYDVQTDTVNVKTNAGGNFQIIDKDIIVSDVRRIRFQINDENGKLLQELMLDMDNGIQILSYNNTPIEIKNNSTSLKEILNDIIDKFISATYVSPSGTATVNPTSAQQLLKLKERINNLLK